MLNTFRSLAGSLAAKICLVFLVLSFAVWGVGDIIRHPGRNQTLASVGSKTITAEAFQRSLRRETENLKRMLGDNYTPEILGSLHLPQHVLQKEINHTLIELESESLGLIPSDSDIVRRIRGNPGFQDTKGNFDKALFEAMLQHNNMTETGYVEQMRHDISSSMLLETLTSATPVNDTAIKTLMAAREEQRSTTVYRLSQSLVTGVGTPDEAAIQEYFKAHEHEFTAPEIRKLSYVTLTAADAKDNAKSSDEELRAIYKERIEEFKKPERRAVEQLLYSTEDAAKKAKAMLAGGKGFDQVAKETDILNKNSVSLGKVERNNVLENAADAVFTLKVGETTDPIQSPFGWHIFRVSGIEAPTTSSFEEIKPSLEKDMKQRNADDALNKIANKLEDTLAGGGTLQEAAGDLGLKVRTVGPVTREGLTPDGGKAEIPTLDKFLDVAFKADDKGDSPMTTAKGGIFYLVHVDSATPERVRPLAEVKAQVISGWQKQERQKRLGKLAEDIAKQFDSSATRPGVVEKYSLEPAATASIKHTSHTAGEIELSPFLIADVFTHKPGQGTGAYPVKGGDYLIAVVNSVIAAPPAESDAHIKSAMAEMRKTLEGNVSNEILDQYTRYLIGKYPVSINESVFQAVLK